MNFVTKEPINKGWSSDKKTVISMKTLHCIFCAYRILLALPCLDKSDTVNIFTTFIKENDCSITLSFCLPGAKERV